MGQVETHLHPLLRISPDCLCCLFLIEFEIDMLNVVVMARGMSGHDIFDDEWLTRIVTTCYVFEDAKL